MKSPALLSLVSAARIVAALESQGAFLTRLLNEERERYPSLEHRRIAWMAKTVLERRAGVDALLAPHLSRPLAKVSPIIRSLLRIAVVELQQAEAPAAMIVSNHVEAAKILGHGGTVGFVNAVLRKLAGTLDRVVEGQECAAEESHPAWIIDYLERHFGDDEAQKLLASHNTEPRLTFRVNTLKTSLEALRQELAALGLSLSAGQYLVPCLTVSSLGGLKLSEIPALLEGRAFIQDESAGLVPTLLEPQPGEFIVDLCSAPGGKTAGIALLMEGTGEVYACDKSGHRLSRVQELVARLQLPNVRTVHADGATVVVPRPADRVLVDAPCSGFGNLGRHKEARWRLSHDDILRQQPLQVELLSRGASLVRPGGILVYSTCSLAPEENEDVVILFQARHPEFELFPSATIPRELQTEAGYLRSFPHRHRIGGAFAARFIRRG